MQPDPTRRSLIGNRTVRQFEQKPVSEFEPIKTEDLIGRDFIIFNVAGEINVGQYGPSLVVEITTHEDTTVGHSWLVNKNSVIARQIEDEQKKGRSAFPIEVSLKEMPSANGRFYYSLVPPEGVLPDSFNSKAPKGK